MPRLFVAIDIPDETREDLANICHGLQGARWVDMSQMHLTLAFLGEVDEGSEETLSGALYEIRGEPFELSLGGVGFFPPRKYARSLWAGVRPSDHLLRLQTDIARCIRGLGLPLENRAFSPHITIARFRLPATYTEIAPYIAAHSLFYSGPFPVSGFQLYTSELSRDGAVHTVEQRYQLHR